ncbi:transposase family protein [Pseudoalteromonas maricaloris]|uniref:transposase family protein n=1 Tax=Pseudoalteromonas maricaloris TaxID=184924 RepID=UPI00351DA8C0
MAIFSGADGWKSIQEFGELQLDWLRHHCSFENDIPKRHCVANIISALDADTLLEALLKWINSRREAAQSHTLQLIDASRMLERQCVQCAKCG